MMNKLLIVVVDDNIEILHTIVRDLRAQYGSSYRILSADSGEKILDALPRLQLANKSISLFIIDQRMPKITGIELLEKVSRFFPDAKGVLLTAYADTNVAIQAINKTKIDYYLSKPWTPSEVNLYPIISNLLKEESLAQTMSKYLCDRLKVLLNIKVKTTTEVVSEKSSQAPP